MSNDQHISFFQAESIRHARTLSYSDALSFLRGMIACLPDDDDACDAIREHVRGLRQSDEQLELLASSQMRISFPPLNVTSTPLSAKEPRHFRSLMAKAAKKKGARRR